MNLLDLLLHLDHTLGTVIADYGMGVYLLLFLIVFCETAVLPLFFLPANPLLFLAGAFGASGMLGIAPLLGVLVVAAWSGSLVNYQLGQRLGEYCLHHPSRWLDHEALLKTHAFYQRHGRVSVLFSLFIPVVRTFSPFVAGISNMGMARFALYAAAGSVLWVGVFVSAGYFFGNLPMIRDHLNQLLIAGVALGVGGLLLARIARRLRKRPGKQT